MEGESKRAGERTRGERFMVKWQGDGLVSSCSELGRIIDESLDCPMAMNVFPCQLHMTSLCDFSEMSTPPCWQLGFTERKTEWGDPAKAFLGS
jgi:hypothetical protein